MGGIWLSMVKRNRLNICGIFVIVFLTVALGVCFTETDQHMNRGLGELQGFNLEDFSFFPNVTEEDIVDCQGDYWEAAEKKALDLAGVYDFDWEKHEYTVIQDNGNTVRLFPDTRKMNRYKIVEGHRLQENEIMLDYNYAAANHLKIGEAFSVGEENYTISAFIVLSDMVSPIVDDTGKMYDKTTQCLAVVSEDKFQGYEDTESIHTIYSGIFRPSSKKDTNAMKRDENFYLFVERDENPQIFATVNSQINMNRIIMGFSMGILSSIAVLLVLITVSGQIKGEYKNLGVLKALGYTNFELTRKYMSYFFIVGIPALLGYFAGHWLAVPFYGLVFGNFSVPVISGGVMPGNMLLFVFVPALFFALAAFLWAMFKVRKPALSMIYNEVGGAVHKLAAFQNRKMKKSGYLKGVKSILLFSKVMVLIFVLFSGFALGVQIQFAYTAYNMTSSIKGLVLQEYNYENNIRFTEVLNDSTKYQGSLKYLCKTVRLKAKGGSEYYNLDLYAVGGENMHMLDLRSKNGTAIDLQQLEGVVINEWMRVKYGLKEGEEITVLLDNEEYLVPVAAVSQSVYGTNLYVGKETAKKLFGLDSAAYNGIFTNDNTVSGDENVLSVITKTEMGNIIGQSTDVYVILSVLLFVCGLVVGTITLTLSLSGVVQGNRKYISLMKVLGYTEKECNFTVMNGYRTVAVIGFVVSIPYTIALCTVMFRMISINSNMAYPTSINIISIVCCLLITVGIVEIILWIFRKKLQKVSFWEIMEA